MFSRISKLFEKQRRQLLNARAVSPLGIRQDLEHVRSQNWKAASTPKDLMCRHVEITGPGNDAKMVINALNSQADGYMFDLEDSMSPTVANVRTAHQNIRRIVDGTLAFETASKSYRLNDQHQPTFHVRARGLHLPHHDGGSGMLYDIVEFLEGSAHQMIDADKQPYLYIPKLESYEEAAFVNSVLEECEDYLGLPVGTVKTTVLIETFPAIFQTDEIIYALNNRIVGLNCGRWDYLFSMMKSLPDHVFEDRAQLTMGKSFMEAYVRQIVSTCHRRDIHAMGGMSAFIPSKGDMTEVLKKIADDKMLEISRGCDGAWVAHPGLIEPVKALFQEHIGAHQKTVQPSLPSEYDFYPFKEPLEETDPAPAVAVASEYISNWLDGNGAVAINGLMEDMATAEISLSQVRNWVNNGVVDELDLSDVKPRIRHITEQYIKQDADFIADVAGDALQHPNGFSGIKFEPEIDAPVTGVDLTRHRGQWLKEYLRQNESYGFLGTSNGVSAVNVVAGGAGRVGPYAGGWQINAMKNRLGMCLPDTLHVVPEEAANCAAEINEHLYRAHLIQANEGLDHTNYYDIALLADLEQGWNTPEKTRIAVRKAVENGINVIHIEDQGDKKRCGHLGDKELNTYDDYAVIMRSANLAAQEMGVGDSVTFVARTDAYSAKRIHNSVNLKDYTHPEYKFVDWERGNSPDGKYLYLKTGVNPETGNTYGLDLSIQRGAAVVSDGLASHVWMETPDADLQVAKDFLDGVNAKLAPEGKQAYGLYNHSPSFDWDVKFVSEARPMAKNVLQEIEKKILIYGNSMMDDSFIRNPLFTPGYESAFKDIIVSTIIENGQSVQGDAIWAPKVAGDIVPHVMDYLMGEREWKAQFKFITNGHTSFKKRHAALKEAMLSEGYDPAERVSDIIVDARLQHFGPQLASFGYNMHLITLPEFHVTAYRMFGLARQFRSTGIEAFVSTTQRPERQLHEADETYTYYKHQTATGTGVEAAFNKAVGSSNVNTLTDSTEADDIKKRSI